MPPDPSPASPPTPPPAARPAPGPTPVAACSVGPGPGPIRPACPACGGPLMEVRAKLQCARCRTICETCCEGGRG